ncbi:transglycosylase SLT domain-containing protein [Kitasatospora sp. NPDC051853]|uniref:transglycosylase SLT domain-containing protein n=1 Tax=Kitasatospora sp. NPDC051853 TaxID=3364058 RepID=UPI00378EEF57
MTTLSPAQIANVAYRAGWRGEDLVVAVAVALAESSGRTDVVNSIGCVGLYQINVPVHVKARPSWTTEAMKNPDANAAAAMVLWKERKWQPWEVYTNGMFNAQMGRARLAVAQVGKTSTGTPSVTPADDVSGGTVVDAGALGWLLGKIPIPGLPGGIGGGAGSGIENLIRGGGGGGDSDGGGGGIFGLVKAAYSVTVLMIRGAQWTADPHNWLRVTEVLAGGVALVIGLKMLAATDVSGPVAGAVRGGVNVVGKGVKAAKSAASKAGQAGAAAATGGASVAAKTAAVAAKGAK